MKKSNFLEQTILQKELNPSDCSLEIWINEVAQKQRLNTKYGRDMNLIIPDRVLNEGPLRQSIIAEFASRALSEDYASRGICYLAAMAESTEEHEFLITQIFDEGMHGMAFKHHLEEINACDTDIDTFIRKICSKEVDDFYTPFKSFYDTVVVEEKNYLGGIALLTVIFDGVLAPTAEMGELKWRNLNPVASDIQRLANIDEIRHLTVCSNIIKKAIAQDSQVLQQLSIVIHAGMEMWNNIPIQETVFQREELFQQGMIEYSEIVGDQPLTNELKLIESTSEQRLHITLEKTQKLQFSRMKYMGLEELM